MKVLKIIGFTVVAIIVALLLIAAVAENDYAVEREIIVNEPKDKVFEYIKYLKNQDNWSRWASADPNMKKSFSGTDGQVGFVSAWDSDNEEVGKGEQEITKIIEGERVETELRFIEPFESTEMAYMAVEEIEAGKTKVIWGFEGSMDYPMNLLLLTMDFDAMLGADFEYGLGNLKDILESE
ncbi:SRPBCC family protein [Marivirga arenosa]|jgi:hypothetical protein|uniref:SRPBCC family protein n=1 Tax=Marivirga arenosa TaxID=3059076 RepID=A0AA49GJ89_9BACT|nr:SRPBCC family protein [Marivirga sp. BKB1-2]WKK81551.2 SRPBCC family protein [Marivirga sp. BKB1-2]